jgi:hypothetical protein
MLSRVTRLLFAFALVSWAAPALAQNEWIDTILPANHLLEKLPRITVDGADETGGLFEFIDLNGDGRKDLLLAYRAQVEAAELEKPHDQTLAVCFYDPKGGHYVKLFEETGPKLSALRVTTQNPGQRKFLLVEREATGGVVWTRGFAVLQGKMPLLFDLKTPPLYLKAVNVGDQVEMWVSGKAAPQKAADADKTFRWDEAKAQFLSKSGEVLSDKVLVPTPTFAFTRTHTPTHTFTPTHTSTPEPKATDTPVPIVRKPKPVVEEKPVVAAKPAKSPVAASEKPLTPAEAAQSASTSSSPAKAANTSAVKWWAEPLDAASAYEQLRNEIVPSRIKSGNLTLLGQQAKAYFAALTAKGVPKATLGEYRAGYYTAVASNLRDIGRVNEAKYYLNMVLKSRPDYPEALKLQAELQ